MEAPRFTASCANVGVCSTDIGVCNIRGLGAQLALTRGKTGKGDDGRPVTEGSRRFFGYLFEGMHVDERETAQGM
jgi:hypothetical protein